MCEGGRRRDRVVREGGGMLLLVVLGAEHGHRLLKFRVVRQLGGGKEGREGVAGGGGVVLGSAVMVRGGSC